MRISTQIVAGYLLAVAATAAVGALSYFHVRAAATDVDEIAEEWHEMQAVAGALAALHGAAERPGGRAALRAAARRLEEMSDELSPHGDNTSEPHESRERAMFSRLADQLRTAADAPLDAIGEIENRAISTTVEFWREDRGRVEARLVEIRKRQLGLRELNLLSGLAILLLPLVILAYLQVKVMRPLTAIQRRVEAIGDLVPDTTPGMSPTGRLAHSIERIAESFEMRQHALQEQVESRTHQLRHAERLGGLGRIAAAVAHEINNPLGSIGLCIEGIQRSLGDKVVRTDEIRRYLETVASEIERCTETTSKLLSYAHYRPNDHRRVGVDELVRSAVDLVKHAAKRAGVSIEIAGGARDCFVCGDVGQLRQVLVNLCLNALDASPRGEGIEIRVASGGEDISIRVADRGTGIRESDRDKIFHPFFTTKRPGEGTGLGLSIAQEIVEAHGGSLRLVSQEDGDRGATFEVRLPRPEGTCE